MRLRRRRTTLDGLVALAGPRECCRLQRRHWSTCRVSALPALPTASAPNNAGRSLRTCWLLPSTMPPRSNRRRSGRLPRWLHPRCSRPPCFGPARSSLSPPAVDRESGSQPGGDSDSAGHLGRCVRTRKPAGWSLPLPPLFLVVSPPCSGRMPTFGRRSVVPGCARGSRRRLRRCTVRQTRTASAMRQIGTRG